MIDYSKIEVDPFNISPRLKNLDRFKDITDLASKKQGAQINKCKLPGITIENRKKVFGEKSMQAAGIQGKLYGIN